MYFKLNDALEKFYASFGVERPDQFSSRALLRKAIDAGILEEDGIENYGGMTVYDDTIYGDYRYNDVARMLGEFFHADVTFEQVLAFYGLTLLGEGDCPHCGGFTKCVETYGHELNDGDYCTPNSYIVDYYVQECPVCGERYKMKP